MRIGRPSRKVLQQRKGIMKYLIAASFTAVLAFSASAQEQQPKRSVERGDYQLSTPYGQLTPAQIAAAKQAAKKRQVSKLVVCADPGNMPLSDNRAEGYQNKIIEAVAKKLGATVEYFWRPYLERGLTRETFANDECHLLLDMPADLPDVLTTIPIYRSTYVLAYRSDENYDFKSFDDPRLPKLRLGTYQHSALRMVLARHGIKNLASLAVISPDADLRPEKQPWRQVQDVVDGKLDVAGVWGPFAGWLKAKGAPLTVQPVNLMEDEIPMEFSLAIGVQHTDVVLKFVLDYALMEMEEEITAILKEFGVPLVQCSDCVATGDIPSHGSYDKRIDEKYEARFLKPAIGHTLSDKASADQRVTRERLEAWLAEGADIDAELVNAVRAYDVDRIAFLLEKGAEVNKLNLQGYAPLHAAARNRASHIIELLLKARADPDFPDADGATALVHAIGRNHVPSVEVLIKGGAEVDRKNAGGYTPLEVALGDNKLFAARVLIEAGADVNVAGGENKVSPLMLIASQLTPSVRVTHLAAGPRPMEIAELLIAKGANVNAQSATGVTALMVAAGHNNSPMIGLLLGKGADPAIKNAAGKTARDIASLARNELAVGALELLATPPPN